MEAVFPASGNEFSIECYSFLRVETDFFSSALLFRAHFVLVETIIQIKVNQFLIEKPLSYYWKPFSTRFVYIFLPVEADFRHSENVFFLTKPSFRLVESEFLFSGNSILLFTAFLSSCGNHCLLQNPFPLVKMKDFLETSFPLDGKKAITGGIL